MVSIDKIEKGVVQFVMNNIVPTMAETSLERLAISAFAAPFIHAKRKDVEELIMSPEMQGMGFSNENHEVDVELLKNQIKQHMSPKGVEYEHAIFGKFIFTADDVDTLYTYITATEVRV